MIPGLLLCLVIATVATGLEKLELGWIGRLYLEKLVLAILLGAALRSLFGLPALFTAGVNLCAKFLLEVAVMLLGASLSISTVAAGGIKLFVAVACIVLLGLLGGYIAGRGLRLPHRLSLLIACGNAICGNSAISAVAPVIGAGAGEIATAISFTAILGVIVILALPLTITWLHLSVAQYGTLAGLTVYAVPQVLAATAPIGLAATQMGTLVKLLRVLMLGPLVFCLSILNRRERTQSTARFPGANRLIPWFVIGFAALMGVRSLNLLPMPVITALLTLANYLTVLAMAALGLGVDLRELKRVGPRASLAVCASLLLLIGFSLAAIRFLHLA
jgi:uncharacterized integral membrane protein (TIGR00698 family)